MKKKLVLGMLCGFMIISRASVAACNNGEVNTSDSTRAQDGEHGFDGYQGADGQPGGHGQNGENGQAGGTAAMAVTAIGALEEMAAMGEMLIRKSADTLALNRLIDVIKNPIITPKYSYTFYVSLLKLIEK